MGLHADGAARRLGCAPIRLRTDGALRRWGCAPMGCAPMGLLVEEADPGGPFRGGHAEKAEPKGVNPRVSIRGDRSKVTDPRGPC